MSLPEEMKMLMSPNYQPLLSMNEAVAGHVQLFCDEILTFYMSLVLLLSKSSIPLNIVCIVRVIKTPDKRIIHNILLCLS
jgi:hypothetical protein